VQRARRSDVRLERLRLLAIVAPLAYIISLVAILEFANLGFWPESALALGISLPLIALFALGVFRIFGGMQDEVIRNEDRFRNLLESAPDAIVIVDQHGRIVIVNEQAERVFGYRRDELVGASVETLVPEHLRDQHPEHRRAFAGDAQRRPMGAGLALLARRKDGSLFPAEISLSPIASDEGMLVSSVIRDISERRRAEEERERLMAEAEAERERQRIGMDLHDGVIQSIYAVGLNLEAAADDVETAPKEVQARIDKAIEQLSDTIRDIRSYIFDLAPSRARAGDFARSLENLVTEFRVNSLIDARVTIGSHLPELGDEREVALFHIAQEALNNVRKHARASTVMVDVRADDGGVVLTVTDDGAGFDLTADVSDAHHGLRNMQARASALGGDVTFESVPGGGTAVRARVPLTAAVSADA
jgi:PAS domain S-box-containing protein